MIASAVFRGIRPSVLSKLAGKPFPLLGSAVTVNQRDMSALESRQKVTAPLLTPSQKLQFMKIVQSSSAAGGKNMYMQGGPFIYGQAEAALK